MILEIPAAYLISLSLVSIIIGLIILAKPKILNYLVAVYLLINGVAGLAIILMANY